MKTSLLTIGSEITSGEITNTNSAWMSQQLDALGFVIVAQLSVPDDPILIQWAMDKLAEKSNVIVISGGLGPTSDDITRQQVAAWTGRPLIFHDDVWQALSDRFKARGVPIRESHKQQCYFQEGCELLPNTAGTALGFYVLDDRGKTRHIFVLPGPPRELQPMWNLEVLPRLEKLPRSRDFGVRRWNILNVPESEVAELVEEVMAGLKVTLGYRASKPLVRVKVRFQLSDAKAVAKLEELDRKLSQWEQA